MKTRLLGALVGLALSFALSTFAQQRDSVDPQTLEQLKAFGKKWKEAYENNDAAAVAALFTEDAVLVINTGPIYGREAIEKFYADLFQKWRVSNLISHWDQYCPHFIGTAGDQLWSNGEAYLTFQGQSGEPVRLKNYWSSITVREGDVWKDRMLTTFLSPPPAAPAETK